MTRRLLLASSSQCHPTGYLDHCADAMSWLFGNVSEVLFVPYARPAGASHEQYTAVARERLQAMGWRVAGIHQFEDPRRAVESAEAFFIGGGNTFVLLRELYQQRLLEVLRDRILHGAPYLGTSAGSNVAGLSVGTSNDMPIVHPPSFAALGLVPFNLNPHFPAVPPDPTHRGETREQRIAEFHFFNSQPVVALHEDGMLLVEGDHIALRGVRPAYVFQAGAPPRTLAPEARLEL